MSEELDRALDDIIRARINLNAHVSGAGNRKNRSRSGQPILEDVLELPDAPITQSISKDRPVSGMRPWQHTRSGQPILENVLELPDAPSAISSGQNPWPQAPAHPPAFIAYGKPNKAPNESIEGSKSSVPWAPNIRPNPRSGPFRPDQDSRMEEAPPVQPRWPSDRITQSRRHGSTNERPAFWAPNDRPTQSLPIDHESTMADAFPTSDSRPHERDNQTRIPMPTWPRSDVRPALVPASAPQSGPASLHGKLIQPRIPVPTGPSMFADTRTNQPAVTTAIGTRSDVRPAPSFVPASAPHSGPASPHGKSNQPGMTVPTGPRSNNGHVKNDQPGVPVPTAPSSQVRPVPPAAIQWSPAPPRARLGQPRTQNPPGSGSPTKSSVPRPSDKAGA